MDLQHQNCMVAYRIAHTMDLAALAPILLALLISVTAMQSQITQGPANALKKVGDSVSLECVTSSKNCDQVEWKKMEGAQTPKDVYRDGIGILNGFPSDRYNVKSSGGCNLIITQLNINDSGRFSCVLTVDGEEDKRSSILVVINVTESCLSNVTSNALNQYDSYSFSTSINIPAKSVEPSIVMLSFHIITADETETMDDSQPLTVKTTLTGIAKKDITRVCTVHLKPYIADGFDGTVAKLDVCTIQHVIVSNGAADGRPFLTSLLLLFCVSLYEINSVFIFAS